MYTNEEALKDSTNYFNGDELAASVFVGKYALRDEEGNLLESNPDQMHWRLAEEFARIEANYPNPMSKEEIYHLLKNFQYVVAQGSPMSAIGNSYQLQSASNCFVISGPTDAYSGILRTDQEQAQIMKRRGGVGFDISNIRPKGMKTKNAARTTDGIGVFMERFSNTCREVAQGGRRGALMLTISCHHPEIRTFINIKRNLKKVTGANISIRLTDEFMNAVKNGTTVELRWPVSDPNPKLREFVDAKALWDEIVDAAWTSAEPGLLFWDTCQRNTPSDIYRDFGYESLSTNPCLVGDTMVAVADGRGSVSFEDLVKEGKDVPVYCCDASGGLAIRTMRNPRITGYDKDIYEVILDDGSTFKATENHKVMLNDGNFVEISKLNPGDSLHIATRDLRSIKDLRPSTNARSQDYIWWHNSFNKNLKSDHRMIFEHNNGCRIEPGYVIHHKDRNAQNNCYDNLQKMTKSDHHALHAEHMKGQNNPIFKIKADPQKFEEYSKKMSESTTGLKNGNSFAEVSNENIKSHGILLVKKLGRRFSSQEWAKYAKDNCLPITFSNYRREALGDVLEFAKTCAKICDVLEDEIDIDPRLVKTRNKMQEQGYDAIISDGKVLVKKICLVCNKEYMVNHDKREVCTCSMSCSNLYINKTTDTNERRSETINKTYEEKSNKTKINQIKVYNDLKFALGRIPMKKEWESECQLKSISRRFGTKYGFKDYQDLINSALTHNHKVVSVKYCGKENVYNGTVDEFHNFYSGAWKSTNKFGKPQWSFINNRQCGEIILSSKDSCRLMCLNLLGFVSNPFTTKAKFDYGKFAEYAIKAQRLMDDMIDIELEQIDKILSKIQSDPEDEETKFYEIKLWEGIRVACSNGRRTGLGITALGDTLAALGIQYGSKDSIEIAEKIYKTLAINSYKSSCIMAGERGTFPVFNRELEKGHQFLERILNSDNELRDFYEKYGRRNIANTTTAPTGSVSTMTQTTSGIEPAYLVFYKRRKKINPLDGNCRVDFVDDLGDKWQEYPVFHHGFKSWMDINGYTIDETNSNQKTAEDLEFYKNSPYYKATSNDIDWLASVEIQAAAQKWICHAISKTCNVPENCPKSTISEVYMKAWESGCKGFTVYRDKCRDGVLVSNDAKKSNFSKSTAPKRPKILDCEIHETKVSGEEFFVIIGILEGRPYEVFSGKGKISNRKHGKLIKIKRGHYDLETEDGTIRDISSKFTDEEVIIARLTSLSLRHGSDIKFIVDQIEKAPGDMHSFCKSIGRILKKYIPNGEKVTGASCETCGSSTLIREEGCMTCKSCGWSKCS